MRSSALRPHLLLLAGLAPTPGLAQPFPSRPITIVVPEAHGGQSGRLFDMIRLDREPWPKLGRQPAGTQ